MNNIKAKSNVDAPRLEPSSGSIDAFIERYIDAADELERCQRALLPIMAATNTFVRTRDELREHPDFSGLLPKTFFSGSYLDEAGVDGHGGTGCEEARLSQ